MGRAAPFPLPPAKGDTIWMGAVDRDGYAVSYIQSTYWEYGSGCLLPRTGELMQNRGMSFSLYARTNNPLSPGRKPFHTLNPALAAFSDGRVMPYGTMGGDGQPQILLQIAARLFRHEQSVAQAIHAGRWVLRGPVTGFDTWTSADGPIVQVEGNAPADWTDALRTRGHRTEAAAPYDSAFGHAHAIVRDAEGFWAGAADPRARVGAAAGG